VSRREKIPDNELDPADSDTPARLERVESHGHVVIGIKANNTPIIAVHCIGFDQGHNLYLFIIAFQYAVPLYGGKSVSGIVSALSSWRQYTC